MRPLEEDAAQLIEAVNEAFGTEVVDTTKIAHAYFGIYPITASSAKGNVYHGASDYIVTDHGLAGGPEIHGTL